MPAPFHSVAAVGHCLVKVKCLNHSISVSWLPVITVDDDAQAVVDQLTRCESLISVQCRLVLQATGTPRLTLLDSAVDQLS